MESDDIVDPATFIEILETMRAAGISREMTGKFALMFRRKIPADVASPVMEMGPVLEAFATTVVAKLQGTSEMTKAPRQKPANTTQKAHPAAAPKIVRLRVEGKQTSVSLSQELFSQAVASLGSEIAASNVVKQLASEAPADRSRSGYMQTQLHAMLAAANNAMRDASQSSVH